MSNRFDQTCAFEVAEFKAAADRSGTFEALVSVFGNVDRGGDRVMPGAFAKSLAQWEEKGDPIPVIWNHMWENPEAHIGAIEPGDAVETEDGLRVKGRIDLDNPFAKQVYRLLSERRVTEFSFGYNLVDAEAAKADGALNLLEIELFEVGPTLKGMNPATELLAVKALAIATSKDALMLVGEGSEAQIRDTKPAAPLSLVKAGARHSKETLASLTRIRDEVDQLIAAGSPADEPVKSDDAEAIGKAVDPDEDVATQIRLLKARNR
jgi:hypothetical protein